MWRDIIAYLSLYMQLLHPAAAKGPRGTPGLSNGQTQAHWTTALTTPLCYSLLEDIAIPGGNIWKFSVAGYGYIF